MFDSIFLLKSSLVINSLLPSWFSLYLKIVASYAFLSLLTYSRKLLKFTMFYLLSQNALVSSSITSFTFMLCDSIFLIIDWLCNILALAVFSGKGKWPGKNTCKERSSSKYPDTFSCPFTARNWVQGGKTPVGETQQLPVFTARERPASRETVSAGKCLKRSEIVSN